MAPPVNPDGTPNLDAVSAMLDNPAVSGMMSQMASNPEMLSAAMNNPMMRAMAQNNPQMQAMLDNPEMMRTMMNPEVLRAGLQMQRAMGGVQPPAPSAWNGVGMPPVPAASPPAPAPVAPGQADINGLDFSGLINQFNTAAPAPAPAVAPLAPAQRFARQIQALNDMGFADEAANVAALQATNGNVNRAVERLLGGT